MKELWTKEDPSFAGKYYRFSDMPFSPKPLQKPHIPVLIGGNSRAAMRRAVRLGNGWHPFAISVETLRAGMHSLREYAQQAPHVRQGVVGSAVVASSIERLCVVRSRICGAPRIWCNAEAAALRAAPRPGHELGVCRVFITPSSRSSSSRPYRMRARQAPRQSRRPPDRSPSPRSARGRRQRPSR